MRCVEDTWLHVASGRRYGRVVWEPAGLSRALLVLVHGFAEHASRYRPLAEPLAERGLMVAALDLWGHGHSDGARGDLGDLPTCAQDVAAFAEEMLRGRAGCSAYVLFGHSFGGLVAIQIGLHHPGSLRRVIIQSPLLEVSFPIPRWKRLTSAVLARLWPTVRLPLDLDASFLCHDRAVIEAYRSDPLVHNLMSARTYRSLRRTAETLKARAAELQKPVLLLCGSEDRIISVPTALRWFEQLRCEKRKVVFPGCFHELHHEAVRPELIRLIEAWTVAS